MKRTWHWLILIAVLVTAGSLLAAYKVRVLGYPLAPDTRGASWTVQAQIDLEADKKQPVRVDLQLPLRTIGFARMSENFVSPRFGDSVRERTWRRDATWTVRSAEGPQTLYYRSIFYRDNSKPELLPLPEEPARPVLDEPFQTAMAAVVEQARAQSADTVTLASKVLDLINHPSRAPEIRLFLDDPDWQGNQVRIARTLLAYARVPTQQINGFLLSSANTRATPARLLAVHNGNRWIHLDPATGQQGWPDHFLFWWAGEKPAVKVSGARLDDLQWSIRRNLISAEKLAEHHARANRPELLWFSLIDLPLDTQTVYSVLLLIPIGASVIVLMRNVIGVRSLGTFMPVLIALAFRETGLAGGLAMFATVVALGLACRLYLEHLRLLLIPRLSAVLIIVVLLIIGLTALSHRMGADIGLSIGLFPIVILAMVIERLCIIWDERGPQEALVEGLGSMAVSSLAYVAMADERVQHLVFVFPELLLVLLGFTILMGRYTGYRISELFRFRDLTRQPASSTS